MEKADSAWKTVIESLANSSSGSRVKDWEKYLADKKQMNMSKQTSR
jgi:hypothetical protein